MEGRTAVRPNVACEQASIVAPWATSMEGRTAVRPNRRHPRRRLGGPRYFNGGPDGRPAKPQLDARAPKLPQATSMEGRTAVRPNRGQRPAVAAADMALQWRAGRPSGQTSGGSWPSAWWNPLQWRAGRPSGQTDPRRRGAGLVDHTSMEGRTAVRPNQHDTTRHDTRCKTSMEGRTAVRPNPTPPAQPRRSPHFNGGPDGRPAKHPPASPAHRATTAPSMEGRTAVRPNTSVVTPVAVPAAVLQWRAGRPSGQTPLARYGTFELHIRGRLRAVSEALGSFEGPIPLSRCGLPCATRLRAVPGASGPNLALASDDRRA